MKRKLILTVLFLLCVSRSSVAVLYVRSTDGASGDNGSTWALAKDTLANAFAIATAGETIYVSDNHVEALATTNAMSSPGTAASPVRVICVDDAGNPEPPTTLATTGIVGTTSTNNVQGFAGWCYVYGITFSAGSAGSTANLTMNSATNRDWTFENCTLKLNNTSAAASMALGTSTAVISRTKMINTVINMGNVSQLIFLRGDVEWIGTNGTSALAGTVPTVLFNTASPGPGTVQFRGVDLSAAGSGKTLFTTAIQVSQRVLLSNCRLNASVTMLTGTNAGGFDLEVVNCDSGATNYKYAKSNARGDITQETTIVRTGGSSNGTTPISYKFVTTPNSKHYAPLYGPWITFWNESTSSTSVSAEVVTNNVTLDEQDAWIEVEYLGSSSYPLSTSSNDGPATIDALVFGTGTTDQATSSATWAGTGSFSPAVKQTLSKTFTPAMKGPIRARVVLAKASTTMYADNLILNNSARQWMTAQPDYINEGVAAASGGGSIFGGAVVR